MGLTSRFLFNDASWHGQCANAESFRECIRFCIETHSFLRRQGSGLEVGCNFRRGSVGFVTTVQDAVKALSVDQRRSLVVWLDKNGPFGDRPSLHDTNEYYECEREIVTETALAEAAYLTWEGTTAKIVSLPNCKFSNPILDVIWHEGPEGTKTFHIENIIALTQLELAATLTEPDFTSYEMLIDWVQKECRHLAVIKKDILNQTGTTFTPAIAKRARELFSALNSIAEALYNNDNAKYSALCSEWLAGERFSDSSSSEKGDFVFNLRMRFTHPCDGSFLQCYWHGKIRTGVYRLHFEWPPPLKGRRLFVAYLGPKLTKK